MLPADVAEEHILEWAEIAPAGSVIVSGGNSDYRTTRELGAKVAAAGKRMVDIGVSGGVWGYDNGFPLMCGADDTTAFDVLNQRLRHWCSQEEPIICLAQAGQATMSKWYTTLSNTV